MKRVSTLLIVFIACFAAVMWPLSSVTTNVTTNGGTTGTIAKFTGSSEIGDSVLVEKDGNIAIGPIIPYSPLTVFNPSNSLNPYGGQPYAVQASIASDIGFSAAVRGDAQATTGGASGVIGVTWGDASGVTGVSLNATGGGFGVDGAVNGELGGGGGGVFGHTSATSGFSTGLRAAAYGNTGGAVALYSESFSPEGYAARLVNRASGNILVGAVGQNDVPVFRVDGQGRVHANGGFRPFGADFAESMPVKGDRNRYEPGDLLAIDRTGNRRLGLANSAYSTLVAGIYSTNPGVLASPYKMDDPNLAKEVPMAVVGIVPCKVSAENGPIEVGDLLVTSSTPGHAMKGTDRSKMMGAVVGKALEPLRQGKGMVQVLVTLQ